LVVGWEGILCYTLFSTLITLWFLREVFEVFWDYISNDRSILPMVAPGNKFISGT
jgi:hypothetical protein